MVAITYGHGCLQECDDTSDWGAANSSANPLTDLAFAVQNGDYMRLTGTPDNVADEWVYYDYPDEGGATDIDILSNTYTKYFVRWRTSDADTALGARVQLLFSDANTQDLLEAAGVPQFSTAWKVTSGTVTAGKTIDHIRLYADDYPDSEDSLTTWVEYDFVLLCKAAYTLPQSGMETTFEFAPKLPILSIPGASGDISQNLGTELATINLRGQDMEVQTTWKRTSNPVDVVEGEVFLDIWHNMKTEPWQWLTGFLWGSKGGMKATLDGRPRFNYSSSRGAGFDVTFREKRAASAAGETYVERLGLNL